VEKVEKDYKQKHGSSDGTSDNSDIYANDIHSEKTKSDITIDDDGNEDPQDKEISQ
jgi:hypothetical protein